MEKECIGRAWNCKWVREWKRLWSTAQWNFSFHEESSTDQTLASFTVAMIIKVINELSVWNVAFKTRKASKSCNHGMREDADSEAMKRVKEENLS
jgi:hypothetical protein